MHPNNSIEPLGQPLGGVDGHWRHRILHFHIPLALGSAVILFFWTSFPLFQATTLQSPQHLSREGTAHHGISQSDAAHSERDHSTGPSGFENRFFIARFTTATGYVGMALLGLTLLIGPANLLFHRRTLISSYLARDVGTWAAIISVIHVIAGFFVHGPPATVSKRILFYFMDADGGLLTNSFGLANWTGLIATVIVAGLLSISNDLALHKLKAKRWKMLQRLNYALFALVFVHTIFYGALSRITSIPTLLLGVIVTLVLLGQAVGIRLWQQRHSPVGTKRV